MFVRSLEDEDLMIKLGRKSRPSVLQEVSRDESCKGYHDLAREGVEGNVCKVKGHIFFFLMCQT